MWFLKIRRILNDILVIYDLFEITWSAHVTSDNPLQIVSSVKIQN